MRSTAPRPGHLPRAGKAPGHRQRAGADAVHPGYGFLAENAGFAQAVIDAGLAWIGPRPAAIDALGDKVKARTSPSSANAPLVPGTSDPVKDPTRSWSSPSSTACPWHQGGLRRRRARPEGRPRMDEMAELYESAVREAVTAFGRGECFVEQFLDHPRHVETQCLADQHGNVVVVSRATARCSGATRSSSKRPRAVPHRRPARRARPSLQGDPRRGRLRRRRHVRVPRRARR
jgi:acetyl/propionyl-CoA carboxylase alpha subunit